MNGIEKITDRIAQDTQAEIDAIAAQAEEKAAAILSAAQDQAHREKKETADRGRQNAMEHQHRLESMARMEAKKEILAAKQQVIAQAYDLALEKLRNLPEKKLVPLLASLAAKSAETGQEEILLHPAQRAKFGKQVVAQANAQLPQGQLTLGPGDEHIQGGLILRSGPVDINCTFDMLIGQYRAETTGAVTRVLFPEG